MSKLYHRCTDAERYPSLGVLVYVRVCVCACGAREKMVAMIYMLARIV